MVRHMRDLNGGLLGLDVIAQAFLGLLYALQLCQLLRRNQIIEA